MSKETFLPHDRVVQLNTAMHPLMVNFRFISADNFYKAGNDPINGTEIYILPATDQLLKACRTDKKLFRSQPVGKGVGTSIHQFCRDACRNQPTVIVGGVKVMQSSLMSVLTVLAIEWGLQEWYTLCERAGMRFVCGNPDGSKIIIDYRPERPKKMMAVMTGRV